MTEIAEAYFHLKPYNVSAERLKFIGDKTAIIAANIGRKRFPEQAIIEVTVEEGSVKGWATIIIPVLWGAYNFVAEYDGFKQGLVSIKADAVHYSDELLNVLWDDIAIKPSVFASCIFATSKGMAGTINGFTGSIGSWSSICGSSPGNGLFGRSPTSWQFHYRPTKPGRWILWPIGSAMAGPSGF